MYIISIIGVIVVCVVMSLITQGGVGVLVNVFDVPSLLLIILICIPVLCSANLLKDFNKAFAIVLAKKSDTNLTQIKKSIEAVTLAIKTVLCGSVVILIFSLIIILASVTTIENMGPNVAVSFISLLYAFMISIILLPLRARLKVMAIEYMQE